MSVIPVRRNIPRRIATLSVHTSPLEQPGTGDAGGMNVYIVELSKRLAAAGTDVEIFTRATSGDLPPVVELAPGVLVRHVTAGPLEALPKEDLAAQLCAFTSAVLRAEASRAGWYDLVHAHYWLSGQVGWLAKERWGVPLVQSMHTMARVKNFLLADGDTQVRQRLIGEQQVVDAADRLIANTDEGASARPAVRRRPRPRRGHSPGRRSGRVHAGRSPVRPPAAAHQGRCRRPALRRSLAAARGAGSAAARRRSAAAQRPCAARATRRCHRRWSER